MQKIGKRTNFLHDRSQICKQMWEEVSPKKWNFLGTEKEKVFEKNYYAIFTFAPASSNCCFADSASSLEIPC